MLKIQRHPIFHVALFILIALVLHYTEISKPVENILVKIIRPFAAVFYNSSNEIKLRYNESRDNKNLINEVAALKIQINILIAENTNLKLLENENRALREYLNFSKNNHVKTILGNIISRSEQNGIFHNSVVIDKGLKDGVKTGSVLIGNEGILVGKIISVQDYLSYGCLTTDKNCKFPASFQNTPNTNGITSGNLGLTIKMDFIPQDLTVKLGDVVTTSNLEKSVPSGLIIGKVISIQKEQNNVWQSALIEPSVNIENLAIVAIME